MNKTELEQRLRFGFDRPRLHSLFEEGFSYGGILVAAGSGFGKTFAVRKYVEQKIADDNYLVYPIQLSKDDNNAIHFWQHWCSAFPDEVRKHFIDLGLPKDVSSWAHFVDLFKSFFPISENHIFVYDDLHFIKNADVIHFVARALSCPHRKNLTFCLTRLEKNIDTLAPVLSLVEENLVLGIDEAQLCFTEEEVNEYYSGLGIPMSSDLLDKVMQSTGGWAFAVSLAAARVAENQGSVEHIPTVVGQSVDSLIKEEVWLKLTSAEKKVLAKICLVRHVSREMALRLKLKADLLLDIARKTSLFFFNEVLGEWSVHTLLRSFIREQQLLSDDEVRAVYLEAAKFCDKAGFSADAINYYIRSGEYETGLRLVSRRFPKVLSPAYAEWLSDLYELIPKSWWDKFGMARALRLRCLLRADTMDQAVVTLTEEIKKERKKADNENRQKALFGEYYSLCYAKWWRFLQIEDYSFVEDAANTLAQYRKCKYNFRGSLCDATVGSYALRLADGNMNKVNHFIDCITETSGYLSKAMSGNMSGYPDLVKAEITYYQTDLSAAKRYAQAALSTATLNNQTTIANRALFLVARIAISKGDLDALINSISLLERQRENPTFFNRHLSIDSALIWIYSQLDVQKKVPTWVNSLLVDDTASTMTPGFEDIPRLRYWVTYGEYSRALGYIDAMRANPYGTYQYLLGRISCRLLEAVCHQHLGNIEDSVRRLEQAYSEAEPCEFYMPFILLGKEMRTLAQMIKDFYAKNSGGKHSKVIPATWLTSINSKARAFHSTLRILRQKYIRKTADTGEKVLSKREKQVLEMFAQGFVAKEIAEKIGLSENSVRGLMPNIYKKLGANNLASAVYEATTKGLFTS